MILCKEGAEENEKKYIYINESRFLICKESSYIQKVYYTFWNINTVIIKQKQKSLTGIDNSLRSCADTSRPISLDVPSFFHVLMERVCLHCHGLRCFTALILTGTNSPANYLILCSQDRLHSPSLIIPLFILPRV